MHSGRAFTPRQWSQALIQSLALSRIRIQMLLCLKLLLCVCVCAFQTPDLVIGFTKFLAVCV